MPTVPTLGVEEEFLLVDRASRAPADRASQVVADAGPLLGDQLQPEFFGGQVEICTTPVASLAALRSELTGLRATVAAAAADAGCLLVVSGTSPLAAEKPVGVSDFQRYQQMAERFGSVVDDTSGAVCGCHIHVGPLDRAQALAISARLRPWLPALQALAVKSPYCAGRDTAFADWRAVRWAAWPTVGPAPLLDATGYERLADALVTSGLLLDRRMIYWYARPSEHVPTLEIRVPDVSATVDTTVLVAGLTRGLCARLLADQHDGVPVPPADDEVLRAAHSCVARSGLTGLGLDPVAARPEPAALLVEQLFEYATPGLAAAGDLATVGTLLEEVFCAGTGSDHQRAAFGRRRQLTDVVDWLADRDRPRPLSAASARGSVSAHRRQACPAGPSGHPGWQPAAGRHASGSSRSVRRSRTGCSHPRTAASGWSAPVA